MGDGPEGSKPSIATRAVSGAIWTTGSALAARALTLVGTILLVRFISPADWGEVQNASVVVLTAGMFAPMGVGAYLISFPRSGRKVAFHATFVHALVAVIALAIVWRFADRLGPAFDAPALVRFVPGLAASVFLDRLSFMAERPLARDLAFRRISVSRTLGEICYATVALVTAWRGAGAMAVIYGNVARSIVRFVLLLAVGNWREWAEPAPLELRTFRKLMSFGTIVAIETVAEFGTRRWDNLLVGRYFGSATAGNYSLAYNLADLPATYIGEQISDVLVASYGHVPPEKRQEAVLRAATLTTLVMAPLSMGLAAVAPTIAQVFPPQWATLGPMLLVLSAVLVVRPIGAVYSGFLMIVRGPQVPMIGEVVCVITLLALLMGFGHGSPLGVCGLVGVAFAVRTLLYMGYVQRLEGVKVSAGLVRMVPIFAACVPLFVAVMGVRHGLDALGVRPAFRLVPEIAAGGLAYVASALVLARAASGDMLKLVRGALKRRAG